IQGDGQSGQPVRDGLNGNSLALRISGRDSRRPTRAGASVMAFLVTKGDRGPLFVAQTALVIVVSGILANLTFNAIAAALGAGYPYSNFLFLPDDRFADFFKLSFSYPGQPVHPVADHWGVSGLLDHAWADVTKYAGTRLDHFHVPPLPSRLG